MLARKQSCDTFVSMHNSVQYCTVSTVVALESLLRNCSHAYFTYLTHCIVYFGRCPHGPHQPRQICMSWANCHTFVETFSSLAALASMPTSLWQKDGNALASLPETTTSNQAETTTSWRLPIRQSLCLPVSGRKTAMRLIRIDDAGEDKEHHDRERCEACRRGKCLL